MSLFSPNTCNFLSVLFLIPVTISQHLQCYHCINRLSTDGITKQEQLFLKRALFDRFNIPPSSEYCADGGNDVLFRAVSKETCLGDNDTCVRIVSQGDASKKLVLRGCQSTLIKSNFEYVLNYSCANAETSECITTCQQPLCNISHAIATLIPVIISLFAVSIL